MKFIKKTITKIWEGFLQNIPISITAFVVSGGYLIAINKLKELQFTIRTIPSDYFLTPLVLLLVLFAVLIKINRKQQKQLSILKQEPEKDEEDIQLVTHLGVWWKIDMEGEYIEDCPYCACCDPKLKLVQTEWHPDEVFKCSKTKTEYKLYSDVPRKIEQVLNELYNTYFHKLSNQFRNDYSAEFRKVRELNPDMPEAEITKKLFETEPLSWLPPEEKEAIINKHPHPMSALHFIDHHFDSYKKYFKHEIRKKNKTTT